MTEFYKHPKNDSLVVGKNGRTYPSKYFPGAPKNTRGINESWKIMDQVDPKLFSDEKRFLCAGCVAGLLDVLFSSGASQEAIDEISESIVENITEIFDPLMNEESIMKFLNKLLDNMKH